MLAVRTNGVFVFVDEFLSATASQAAPLQSAFVTGCNLALGASQAYGTTSADGTASIFSCGLTSSTARSVARIANTGAIDVTTNWTTGSAAYPPVGVCTADGQTIVASDFRGTYVGPAGNALTAGAGFGVSTEYGCSVAPLGNGVSFVSLICASSTTVPCPVANSALYYFNAGGVPGLGVSGEWLRVWLPSGHVMARAYPSRPLHVMPALLSRPPAGTSYTVNAQRIGVPAIGQLAINSNGAPSLWVMYIGGDATSVDGGLYKLTSTTGLPSGNWTLQSFGVGPSKNPSTGVGVHGLVGRTEAGGAYILYLSTSSATQNQLFR